MQRSGATRSSGRVVVAAPLRVEAFALRRGDPSLRIVRAGMGFRSARRAARRLLSDPAGAVAVAGVCGSLVADLVPGDVLVPDALLAPDGRVARRLDPAPLRDALAAIGIPSHTGALIGSQRLILGGPERAQQIASGARAVDMESVWLAAGAGDRPFAVLRVVSDGPGHELFRPSILWDGVTALRRLRDAAPALAAWASRAVF
jgi:4-hydroxy-3-methylbut-2-enyl diphosphate reductase